MFCYGSLVHVDGSKDIEEAKEDTRDFKRSKRTIGEGTASKNRQKASTAGFTV